MNLCQIVLHGLAVLYDRLGAPSEKALVDVNIQRINMYEIFMRRTSYLTSILYGNGCLISPLAILSLHQLRGLKPSTLESGHVCMEAFNVILVDKRAMTTSPCPQHCHSARMISLQHFVHDLELIETYETGRAVFKASSDFILDVVESSFVDLSSTCRPAMSVTDVAVLVEEGAKNVRVSSDQLTPKLTCSRRTCDVRAEPAPLNQATQGNIQGSIRSKRGEEGDTLTFPSQERADKGGQQGEVAVVRVSAIEGVREHAGSNSVCLAASLRGDVSSVRCRWSQPPK
ncbi:hypothetical protein KCU89_g116, partial [Aureobasidium melanogenum]